jgi:hypothetical protein
MTLSFFSRPPFLHTRRQIPPEVALHSSIDPPSQRSARAAGHVLLALAVLGAGGWSHPARAQTSPSSELLVQQSNLTYQGAFRVPQLGASGDAGSYDYGGTALGYNPTNNSLFLAGYDPQQWLGEISIPTLQSSSTIGGLAVSKALQALSDPSQGTLNNINPTDPNPHKLGGVLVSGNNLYFTAYSYYDGNVTQKTSQFVRPVNLSTTGQVQGPFTVGTQYQGFVDGYMTWIPSEWQALFGGPALVGNCCLAITSAQSNGPAASVYNPANVGTSSPVPATPVVGYPYSNPLGTGWGTQSTLYNGTTHIRGIVFPPGTRSVLFFGRHGTGSFCYGPGTSNQSLAGQPADGGVDVYCYDPADSSKGVHAYPYVHQVWAYDANDLLSVKNGTKQQYQIQPYAVWQFSLPFDSATGMMDIGGAAFDPRTGNVYVSQLCADTNCGPVVHVFNISNGTQTQTEIPDPPTNLTVQ